MGTTVVRVPVAAHSQPRAYSLASSACASAISGISGVGKSLRAPAAQLLGDELRGATFLERDIHQRR